MDFMDGIKHPKPVTTELNYSDTFENIIKIYLEMIRKVNDKIEELYDDLTIEEKSLISIEEFAAMFKVDYEFPDILPDSMENAQINITLMLKTPEELLEEYGCE